MDIRKTYIGALLVFLMGLVLCGGEQTMEAKYRHSISAGIIEGFYGSPWTQETRLEVLDFLHETGMQGYIYAPKDDPYHREAWRDPYPIDKLDEIKVLVERAKQNNILFTFAISPGLSLHFSGEEGERDFADLLKKMRTMHDIGVTSFAVFFDDIENKDGIAQAQFLNRVEQVLRRERLLDTPLLTVPVEYAHEDMKTAGQIKAYTKDFSATLSKSIEVFYTGEGVAKSPLTTRDANTVARLYDRKMAIWWNYPVNDYMEGKWALGAMEGLAPDLETSIRSIYYNPMSNWRLSRIALRTGADYAKDPQAYDAAASLTHALREEFGALAPDMAVVARHSQHLKNDWADIGAQDAPLFQKVAVQYWTQIEQGEYPKEAAASIQEELQAIYKAHHRLESELDHETYRALQPQLEQLVRMAKGAETVLLYAQAKNEGNETSARMLRRDMEKTAAYLQTIKAMTPRISEQAIGAFLERAVKIYDTMEK